VSPFPTSPNGRPSIRPGRVVREGTGQVVWEGQSREAEGEAIRLNRETEGSDSFRPEELDDDGTWQSMGFRGGGFRGAR
jgi:hypothetical protein